MQTTSIQNSPDTELMKKGNTIFTIFPYKLEGQWLFDDKQRDVYREAFVAGADDMLDLVCKGAEKCTALFSASKFPDHDLTLKLVEGYSDGSGDYFCEELKHNLWLCSCLKSYFPTPPESIFLKIKM